MEKHKCSPEHAERFRQWIAKRGGLFVWQSVNLSNPGASWTTPAQTEDGKPYPSPTWQADHRPSRHITDPAEVEVVVPREVKRFHIGVERGCGLSFKVTAGGTRRIRAAVDKAGEGAWYELDHMTQEAVILVEDRVVCLSDWEPI